MSSFFQLVPQSIIGSDGFLIVRKDISGEINKRSDNGPSVVSYGEIVKRSDNSPSDVSYADVVKGKQYVKEWWSNDLILME